MSDKTRVEQIGANRTYMRKCKRQQSTWPAQFAMLLLLSSVHLHAPGVEGKGEQVLQARGRTHYDVQAFQPFLTLLKGGELTPEN